MQIADIETIAGIALARARQAAEPIKELKREGKLEKALRLCCIAIEGAEGATRRDGYGPPRLRAPSRRRSSIAS